ncbi:MAG: PAS domain-containing protein, partial [Calditrichaeota bacterium]
MLWLAIPVICLAQLYRFQIFTVQEGLPSPTVYDVAQDSLGRIWFATRNGIASYDGLSWQYFSTDQGLLTQEIKQLKIDRYGRLWAVPEKLVKGIFYFDGQLWVHKPPPSPLGRRNKPLVTCVQLTYSPDGAPCLWLGTDRNGLFCYRQKGWLHFSEAGTEAFSSVFDLAARGNVLYLATDKGVFIFDPTSRRLRPLEHCPNESIHGIELQAADSTGEERIWLAGKDWVGFLQKEHFTLLARHLPFVLLTPFEKIAIHATRSGDVFAGNPYGLCLIAPNGQVKPFDVENGLVATGANCIFEDREGNLWFAGLRGVSKLSTRRFANYRRLNGLFADEVTAIAGNSRGQVFLGHHGGLSVFQGQTLLTQRLPLPAKARSYSDRIMDMLVDTQDRLWVVTVEQGVMRRRNNGTFETIPVANHPRLSCIFQDQQGRIWLGTYSGLYRLAGNRFVPEQGLANLKKYIRTISQASEETLLLATPEGLIQYQVSTATAKVFSCTPQRDCSVYNALPLPNEQILVGTRKGLYVVQGDSLAACSLPGLSLQCPIFFIRRDNRGRLWLGTDRGVFLWDNGRTRHFTIADGLIGMETNREAVYIEPSGWVWIGTDQGLSIYQPEQDRGPLAPPRIQIGPLQTSQRTLALSGKPLELSAGENELMFHFSAISFWEENAPQVRYRLAGYDSTWFYDRSGATRQIRYTNLPPGRYRFEIQASSQSGRWSPIARSAWIQIARPYWQTPWFLGLVILSLIAAGAGATSIGQQICYRKRLEVEVARRTAQLERSEARYRRLFENTGEVVFACDSQGLLVEINPAALQVFGCDRPEELIGKHLGRNLFVDPEAYQQFHQSLQAEGSVQNWEVQILDLRGEPRTLRISATALRDQNGNLQGFSGLMRD